MPQKLLLALFFISLSAAGVQAQQDKKIARSLKEGDIVFQKLPCGSLCDAIIETTPCQPGLAFNHCGIVHFNDKNAFVIEAIGKAVQQTSLDKFLSRDTSSTLYVGRPRLQSKDITAAVKKAEVYVGTPYDNAFLPGDSSLYCSELVWVCYKDENTPLFSLQPMTFKSPRTDTTYAAWTDYYKQLNTDIPEGVQGLNPCAIANSDKIRLIELER